MSLPRYRCHKEVRAFKIAEVRHDQMPAFLRPVCRGSLLFGSACGRCERCQFFREHGDWPTATLVPQNPELDPVKVGSAYLAKHRPEAGGYYVRYDDGYESFSKAKAFEEGYTLLGPIDITLFDPAHAIPPKYLGRPTHPADPPGTSADFPVSTDANST